MPTRALSHAAAKGAAESSHKQRQHQMEHKTTYQPLLHHGTTPISSFRGRTVFAQRGCVLETQHRSGGRCDKQISHVASRVIGENCEMSGGEQGEWSAGLKPPSSPRVQNGCGGAPTSIESFC